MYKIFHRWRQCRLVFFDIFSSITEKWLFVINFRQQNQLSFKISGNVDYDSPQCSKIPLLKQKKYNEGYSAKI